jgi:hypothetical protein
VDAMQSHGAIVDQEMLAMQMRNYRTSQGSQGESLADMLTRRSQAAAARAQATQAGLAQGMSIPSMGTGGIGSLPTLDTLTAHPFSSNGLEPVPVRDEETTISYQDEYSPDTAEEYDDEW